jgi:uncharacterized membrane protein
VDDFKRFFLRGLTVILPTLLTIALLVWAYDFIDQHISRHITRGLVSLLTMTGAPNDRYVMPIEDSLKYGTPIDEWDPGTGRRLTVEYRTITFDSRGKPEAIQERLTTDRNRALWRIASRKWKLNVWAGFVLAIILVYFTGRFLASFIGRSTWRMFENLVLRLPLIRAIYPNIKQVTDFLFSDRQLEFSGVVAVPYPRKGLWSIGLVTGSPMKLIQSAEESELMTVFIPSSPTPVTGYTITVRRNEVIELGLSIDEALRYIISAGVIKPNSDPSLIGESKSKMLSPGGIGRMSEGPQRKEARPVDEKD